MSLLLEDMLTFLIDSELYEGLGVDAFWDKLPDSPDSCIALFEYQGMGEYPWETDATQRSVQLVCREPSALLAKAQVTKVHNLIKSSLDETGRIDFNGRFAQVMIRQTPFKMNEDDSSRVAYGFNMGITTSIDS